MLIEEILPAIRAGEVASYLPVFNNPHGKKHFVFVDENGVFHYCDFESQTQIRWVFHLSNENMSNDSWRIENKELFNAEWERVYGTNN